MNVDKKSCLNVCVLECGYCDKLFVKIIENENDEIKNHFELNKHLIDEHGVVKIEECVDV